MNTFVPFWASVGLSIRPTVPIAPTATPAAPITAAQRQTFHKRLIAIPHVSNATAPNRAPLDVRHRFDPLGSQRAAPVYCRAARPRATSAARRTARQRQATTAASPR